MAIARVDRDSWKRQALCAGRPDREAWFSDEPDAIRRAKAVCRACPVNAECLSFALKTGPHDGIWAGTSPYERRRLRRVMASAS